MRTNKKKIKIITFSLGKIRNSKENEKGRGKKRNSEKKRKKEIQWEATIAMNY